MATNAAEKYQLKWHSHVANLNSSVVNLFRNEKFADVLLMTSNSHETCGIIPAHKVILSSCSHYFSTVFETSSGQVTANSIIYVILPPELTKRALEILVQYIYCGEATVHNDVLNEVLKGGELLKIRGLWRSGGSSEYIDHLHHYPRNFVAPPATAQSSQHHHLPGTSSQGREARIQIAAYERERPVVIRNNPGERSPARDQPIISSRPTATYAPTVSSVYVKKDMAQYPGNSSADCEACRITLQSSSSNEANPEVRPHPPMPQIDPSAARVQPSMMENHFNSSSQQNIINNANQPKSLNQLYSSKAVSEAINPSSSHMSEREGARQIIHHPPSGSSFVKTRSRFPPGPNLNDMPIKQEPPDWHEEYEQKPQLEVQVKREVIYHDEADTGSGADDGPPNGPMYTPLSCELCKETFTVPGEWVRHIENHAETPQTVPKKRRRTEDITDNMASLKCDLCSMYFLMPADWVRHIQKTHTENELAVSNTLAKTSTYNNPESLLAEQNCSVCTKSNYAHQNGSHIPLSQPYRLTDTHPSEDTNYKPPSRT